MSKSEELCKLLGMEEVWIEEYDSVYGHTKRVHKTYNDMISHMCKTKSIMLDG